MFSKRKPTSGKRKLKPLSGSSKSSGNGKRRSLKPLTTAVPATPPARPATSQHTAPKARPKPDYPPFGKPVGEMEEDGTYTVPYHDRPKHPAFKPIIANSALLDDTIIHVDFERNRIVGFTTVSDGLVYGWDTCGHCHGHITNCWCNVYHMPDRIAVPHSDGSGPNWAAVEAAAQEDKPKAKRSLKKKPLKKLSKKGRKA